MEDAELLQRDPNQLVLDVYASGRQNMLRDELVIAKTVDFLVEHATAVAPEPAADEAAAAAAEGEAAAPKGETEGKTVKRSSKAAAPKRRAKKTNDE